MPSPSPLAPISPPRSWPRRALLATAFAAWLVGTAAMCGYLLASHTLTLPTPATGDAELRAALAAQHPQRSWLTLHVLDQDCRCSQRVLAHLLTRGPMRDANERVVWVAGTPDATSLAAIRARGFALDVLSPDALVARYHLAAAPLLVIVAPDGDVRYLGGYAPRKQAADLRDTGVIAATRLGLRVAPLPTFGCAIGALRDAVDPLRLR